MSQEQISEAGLGKALGAAAAVGGSALLANKAGSYLKKNPQAARAIASGAGAAAKGLISLIAPIVKEVGPAVAKSILKQKYGIDIPDITIQKAAAAPTVSTSIGSQGLAVAGQQQPQQQPPVINKSPETTTTTATTTAPSVTPTKTISSDLVSKLQNDPDVKDLMYLNKPDTDPAVVSKKTSIAKKFGINPDDVNSYIKQVNPESVYRKGMVLNEFIPALLAAGEALAPAVARQVALQVGADIAAKAINKKLQQKNSNKNINNNEMEESKKKKNKKVLAKEGIGTGTLGAVAGGLIGGVPGAVIGGLTGAAAPKAVKEIKSAVSGENEEDKKKKKKKVKESSDISKLVSLISQKNYAEADKYLKNVVDSKIKDRIESASNINIF